MNRKELKRNARQNVKRHYLLFLFLCLVLGVIGFEYSSSLSTVKAAVIEQDPQIEQHEERFVKVFELLAKGDLERGFAVATKNEKEITKGQQRLGVISIGHSRGVFSQLAVYASSGVMLSNIASALVSLMHSRSAGITILIIGGLLLVIFVSIFIFSIINATIKRIFLEGRLYDSVPAERAWFFLRVRKWFHVSMTLLLSSVYYSLWSLTVIGMVVKRYSYLMVPYIVAENPAIGARDAITLSRRMMDGHKWEAFVLQMSFIGWNLLDFISLGLVGIFYANPYREAAFAEYYAYVRGEAIKNQIPGYENLNDSCLFELAEESTLQKVYADVETIELEKPDFSEMSAVKRFFRNVLGVCLFRDKDAELYEDYTFRDEVQKNTVDILNRKRYPERLLPVPVKENRKTVEDVSYLRLYSLSSIILIFFTVCMIGWLWEVSLHLVKEGVFVNRGVLHGPWLPIYGSGGVLILMSLFRLRKNALVQFMSAVVVCGVLEYCSSLFLEIMHDGMKWWDYSGYFININGRVCAEGLLVFGIGGVAIVYILAPLLDNFFRKIPAKTVVPVCLALILAFGADQVYSFKHPNKGKGITDYKTAAEADSGAAASRDVMK